MKRFLQRGEAAHAAPPAPAAAPPARMPYRVAVHKGLYVGVFSQEVGDGRHLGHAWICAERPDDLKSAKPLEKVSSRGTYASSERAMQAAEYQARQVIEQLEPVWSPFTRPL